MISNLQKLCGKISKYVIKLPATATAFEPQPQHLLLADPPPSPPYTSTAWHFIVKFPTIKRATCRPDTVWVCCVPGCVPGPTLVTASQLGSALYLKQRKLMIWTKRFSIEKHLWCYTENHQHINIKVFDVDKDEDRCYWVIDSRRWS